MIHYDKNKCSDCDPVAPLLLKFLSSKEHTKTLLEALEKLPSSANEILQQSLFHFTETRTVEDIHDFDCLLGWVLCARRSLTLAELNAALGIEAYHGGFLDLGDKIKTDFSAFFSIVYPGLDFGIRDGVAPGLRNDKRNQIGSTHNIQDSASLLDDKPRVRIAQPSITKFFREHCTSNPAEEIKLFSFNASKARIRMAKTCLVVLCGNAMGTQGQPDVITEVLYSYAANHLFKHLTEIDPSGVTIFDKLAISRNLLMFIRDESVIERWLQEAKGNNRPSEVWVFKRPNIPVGVIWKWISQESVRSFLSNQEKNFIENPDKTVAEKILRPSADFIARKWLEGHVGSWNPFICWELLEGFLCKVCYIVWTGQFT
jgi:hypothetical protein